MSPDGVEFFLNRGTLGTRDRQTAQKRRPKRVSIKRDGELVDSINLDVLMDNRNSGSVRHRECVKSLLKLAGVGDDVQLGGDPSNDQQAM